MSRCRRRGSKKTHVVVHSHFETEGRKFCCKTTITFRITSAKANKLRQVVLCTVRASLWAWLTA